MIENHSESFEKQGYTVIPSLVTNAQLAPLQEVLEENIQQRAEQLHRNGHIDDLCPDAAFEQRWHRIAQQCPAQVEHGIWNEEVFGREIYELIVYPPVLDAIEGLIGQEVTANGDYWVRPMLPEDRVTATPWHQDSGYYGDHPSGPRDVLTVWMPFADVDANNGCLEIIPDSHRWGLVDTCLPEGKQWREPVIDPTKRGAPQAVPMRRGDALIFSNLLFHRSLPNRSNMIRWSVDLRYSRTGLPLPRLNRVYPGFIARSKGEPASVEPFATWRDRTMAVRHRKVTNS